MSHRTKNERELVLSKNSCSLFEATNVLKDENWMKSVLFTLKHVPKQRFDSTYGCGLDRVSKMKFRPMSLHCLFAYQI